MRCINPCKASSRHSPHRLHVTKAFPVKPRPEAGEGGGGGGKCRRPRQSALSRALVDVPKRTHAPTQMRAVLEAPGASNQTLMSQPKAMQVFVVHGIGETFWRAGGHSLPHACGQLREGMAALDDPAGATRAEVLPGVS